MCARWLSRPSRNNAFVRCSAAQITTREKSAPDITHSSAMLRDRAAPADDVLLPRTGFTGPATSSATHRQLSARTAVAQAQALQRASIAYSYFRYFVRMKWNPGDLDGAAAAMLPSARAQFRREVPAAARCCAPIQHFVSAGTACALRAHAHRQHV
jgi:hypothetical protein